MLSMTPGPNLSATALSRSSVPYLRNATRDGELASTTSVVPRMVTGTDRPTQGGPANSDHSSRIRPTSIGSGSPRRRNMSFIAELNELMSAPSLTIKPSIYGPNRAAHRDLVGTGRGDNRLGVAREGAGESFGSGAIQLAEHIVQ